MLESDSASRNFEGTSDVKCSERFPSRVAQWPDFCYEFSHPTMTSLSCRISNKKLSWPCGESMT